MKIHTNMKTGIDEPEYIKRGSLIYDIRVI